MENPNPIDSLRDDKSERDKEGEDVTPSTTTISSFDIYDIRNWKYLLICYSSILISIPLYYNIRVYCAPLVCYALFFIAKAIEKNDYNKKELGIFYSELLQVHVVWLLGGLFEWGSLFSNLYLTFTIGVLQVLISIFDSFYPSPILFVVQGCLYIFIPILQPSSAISSVDLPPSPAMSSVDVFWRAAVFAFIWCFELFHERANGREHKITFEGLFMASVPILRVHVFLLAPYIVLKIGQKYFKHKYPSNRTYSSVPNEQRENDNQSTVSQTPAIPPSVVVSLPVPEERSKEYPKKMKLFNGGGGSVSFKDPIIPRNNIVNPNKKQYPGEKGMYSGLSDRSFQQPQPVPSPGSLIPNSLNGRTLLEFIQGKN